MSGSETEEKTDVGSDDDHAHDSFDESQTELSQIIGGRYRLSKRLGKGSFGETFVAEDMHLFDKPVVVKVLRNFSKLAHNLFAREARRLAELEHPRIPRLKAAFQQGNEHYIVQEYIPGKNLADVQKAEGSMTEEQVSLFMVDVLEALQYVHQEQVIHRDIKLENVVRKDSNKAFYLVDFGASKQVAPDAAQAGITVIGTSGYMAPEVGMGNSTFQSDLFSLGATAMALLTGKKPQELTVPGHKPFDQAVKDLVSGGKITADFGNLLNSLLDTRLDHRIPSAAAALLELRKCAPLARKTSLHTSPSSSSFILSKSSSSPSTPGGSDERKRSMLSQSDTSPSLHAQASLGQKRSSTEAGSNAETKKPRVEEKSRFFQTTLTGTSGTSSSTTHSTRATRSASTAIAAQPPVITVDEVMKTVWSKLAREEELPPNAEQYHEPNETLNQKVALWRGNITSLAVDAIVNAAPRNFVASRSGVNSAVHRIGGEQLTAACKQLGVAEPGETRCTKGYGLPCAFVLHTVGPSDEDPALLRKCYLNSLDALVAHPGKSVEDQSGLVPLRTIAFCCISAGGNAFPKSTASKLAVSTVRKWLDTDDNADKVDLIIFCISKDDQVNYNLYEEMLLYNFPLPREDLGTDDFDE